MTIRFRSEFPILFVSDPAERMVAPDYDPEQVAIASRNGIAIRTIADVDGAVVLDLSLDTPPVERGMHSVFAIALPAPSQTLCATTADDMQLLRISCRTAMPHVTVYVDDALQPAAVWIRVED